MVMQTDVFILCSILIENVTTAVKSIKLIFSYEIVEI